jgi:AcrR family transcriptional regulator
MPRPALRPEEIETRRNEILDVAQGLFEDQGLEAVSLRRIATRAGCSATTPYRYFPSHAHVLLGLRVRAYQAIGVRLALGASAETHAAERLRAVARAYIAFATERREMYALLFRVGELPEDNPELDRAKRDALDVCCRALAQAEAEGELRLRTDVLTAAHLFWAGAHGAVSLHLSGQLVMDRALEDITPILIATLVAGLSEPASAPVNRSLENQT